MNARIAAYPFSGRRAAAVLAACRHHAVGSGAEHSLDCMLQGGKTSMTEHSPALRPAHASGAAPTQSLTPCGLLRRLGCVLYDSLLLLAVLMVGTAAALVLTGGETPGADNLPFKAWLWLLALGYFGYPWVRGGRTLGMQAWRVRLVGRDGAVVDWRRATLRFLVAVLSWLPAGLGFWWSLFDRERLAWHDRASGTRLVVEPRRR